MLYHWFHRFLIFSFSPLITVCQLVLWWMQSWMVWDYRKTEMVCKNQTFLVRLSINMLVWPFVRFARIPLPLTFHFFLNRILLTWKYIWILKSETISFVLFSRFEHAINDGVQPVSICSCFIWATILYWDWFTVS